METVNFNRMNRIYRIENRPDLKNDPHHLVVVHDSAIHPVH
jgi:hypothetical protein